MTGDDEEILETGSARGRRVVGALALLAVAGLVGAVIVRTGGHGAPAPTAATSASVVAGPTRSPSGSVPSAVPAALPAALPLVDQPVQPPIEGVRDLVLGANRLYVFQADALLAYDLVRQRVVARAAVRGLSWPGYRLVADVGGNTVWAVPMEAPGSAPALAFDATTLARRSSVLLPPGVRAAAALDGRMYVAFPDGVRELQGGRAVPVLPSAGGLVESLAADPRRDRLLLLVSDPGDPAQSRLVAERADGTGRAEVAVPLTSGQVVAVRDALWIGGSTALSGRHAAIVQLDPQTLASTGSAAALAARLGRAAVFVGAGSHVVWVRSGDGADGLWCMDASTGAAVQRYEGLGPVVSQDGFGPVTARETYAYAARDGQLRRLDLAACLG